MVVRLDADIHASRARRVGMGGVLAGVGASRVVSSASGSSSRILPLIVAAGAAILPFAGGSLAAYRVARTHRSVLAGVQLALEQILDRLEHGELDRSGGLLGAHFSATQVDAIRLDWILDSLERLSRSMKEIGKVGVIGGGLMGSGIAQVSAAAGFPTTVREISEDLCAKSRQSIEKTLAKGIERGKVTASERDTTLANLRFVTRLEELADADLIIEAVVEDLEIKNSALGGARSDLPGPTRSSHRTRRASQSSRWPRRAAAPDRMLGLHFFNPGAADEAGGGRPHDHHQRRDREARVSSS